MPTIEFMGVSNPDESGDDFREQWEATIDTEDEATDWSPLSKWLGESLGF
tara:strand:- start:1469 stop:1618 length:150 start_codon:yes stop_codon:yes gene_type:complete